MGRLTKLPPGRLVRRLACVHALSALAAQLFLLVQEQLLLYAAGGASAFARLPAAPSAAATAAGTALTLLLTAVLLLAAGRTHPEAGKASGSRRPRELRRMMRLPYIAAAAMTVFVFLGCLAVRGTGWFAADGSAWSGGGRWLVPVADAAAGLTAGLMLLFPARSFIRDSVSAPVRTAPQGGRTTIFIPFAITYAGILLLAVLGILQAAEAARLGGRQLEPAKLAAAAGAYGAVGLLLFVLAAAEVRKDLLTMIHGIRRLVQGSGERLTESMPVLSRDEVGELAIAFNELHERIAAEYEELQRELILASRVQMKLLPPRDVRFGDCSVSARCSPAHEIGGDLYDAVAMEGGRFALLIGDVSGKGVPAALVVSAFLVQFRSEIKRGGGPGELLERINRQLYDAVGDAGTVTAGLAVVDAGNGLVRYASAGHPAPYVVRQGGVLETPDLPALPIGFDPEERYPEAEYRLNTGDRLVLFTDGIVEAMDGARGLYGFDRFERDLREWHADTPPGDWIDALFASLDGRGGGAAADDRTLLAMEFRLAEPAAEEAPEAGRKLQWTFPSAVDGERAMLRGLAETLRVEWPASDRLDDIVTAVAEAAINAAEHGNRLDPGVPVEVDVHIGSHLLVCRVYDSGAGFTPRFEAGGAPAPRPADRNETGDPRGWGLTLINALADYWGTGRSGERFYIELFFLRTKEAGKQGR